MNSHLLRNIEKNSAAFSKGQRLIAEYIEKHYDKAAFMTASKLGATVGVSESTVVRFATEIGYNGYPALQKAMQEMIRSKLTSVQRIEVASDRIGNTEVLDTVLNLDIEKIRQTLEDTSKKDFYAAVEALIAARHIYIVASRSSVALANFLGYYFNLIFDDVTVVNVISESEIFEKMLRVGEQDAVIGISFPRYSSSAAKALRFASNQKARVIAITDSESSPLVPWSQLVLLARSDMVSIVDSLVAPLSLVNALIVAVALKKKNEICERFSQLEQIWDQYAVYEKVEENS